jgi:hypothetical protein
MRPRIAPLALTVALVFSVPALAQEPPPASPADVESLDGLVHALYDVISGPAGQARDWDRMRSLFIPGARLIPSGPNAEGVFGHAVWTVDEYIERSGPFLEQNGFFETEIGRRTDQWGSLVQMFSAYDSRRTPEDPEPFARGINSIQAMHDGERWWIVTVYWTSERPDNPIPESYLGRN